MNSPPFKPSITQHFFDFKYHRLMGGFCIQLPLMIFLFCAAEQQEPQWVFMAAHFSLLMYCFFTTLATLKLTLFDQKITWVYKLLIYYPHLFLQTIFLFSAIPMLINGVFFFISGNNALFFNAGWIILAISVFLSLYCILIRRKWIKLSRHTLPMIENAASDMHYQISHVSDLHVGNLTTVRFLKKLVRQVNQQQSDLIVITGDLITVGDAFLEDIANGLAGLSARDGVIIALGNHDYYCSNVNQFIELLRSKKLNVLHNQHHMIQHGENVLCIVGLAGIVDNLMAQEKALALSIDVDKLSLKNQTNILLAHDSSIFASDRTNSFDLILSGHTHGGQIGLPYLHQRCNLARVFYPFTAGLFKKNQHCYLYVNTGIGVDTLPVRWGVAPEIAVFSLTSRAIDHRSNVKG